MTRRGPNALAAVLLVAAAACSAGCRLHMSRVDLNSPLSRELYESIELGVHDRGDVLERLGPPDQLAYTPTEIVFDYESASHRGTDLRFFIPSDVFPGPSPLIVLQLPRIFFDPF